MKDGPLSPIPSADDIARGLSRPTPIAGIYLNEEIQHAYLMSAAELAPTLGIPESHSPKWRYWYLNGSYGALDAIFLATMCHLWKPRRIIEVGSGHSTGLLLDLVQREITGYGTRLVCIDPDLSRMRSATAPADIFYMDQPIEKPVQDIPTEVFQKLQKNDILFVDSSHVSKIGSDVNDILFRILPALAPGVLVHFHDVFDNFEYPREWFAAGRYWNEQYLLRAFLMGNRDWEILAMTARLFNQHNEIIRKSMPAAIKTGGGSLWIRRV